MLDETAEVCNIMGTITSNKLDLNIPNFYFDFDNIGVNRLNLVKR